jgi:hypothetical protein
MKIDQVHRGTQGGGSEGQHRRNKHPNRVGVES